MFLLQQQQLLCFNKVSSLNAIEVHSTRHARCVPSHRLVSSLFNATCQCCYLSPQQIVHLQHNVTLDWQLILYSCAGIERVWIIGEKGKSGRVIRIDRSNDALVIETTDNKLAEQLGTTRRKLRKHISACWNLPCRPRVWNC